MARLINQPASPLQRVIQCAQRTIAIAVVGCAALSLWAGPASAADTPPLDPATAAATEIPAPPAPLTDVPPVADQVAEATQATVTDSVETAVATPVPVQTPELPQVAASAPPAPQIGEAARTATSDLVSYAAAQTSHTAASIHSAAPASGVANAKAPAVDVLPASEIVNQTSTQLSSSANLDEAAGSLLDSGGAATERTPTHPSGMLRGGLTPPRSIADFGAISVTVKRVAFGGASSSPFTSPFTTFASGEPTDAGPSSTPASTVDGGSLPGLPGPLQIPVLGSAGASTTSSTGFFFFGFAGLLVGLWAAFAPALSRRLQGSPAGWRPAPYLSLLELPG